GFSLRPLTISVEPNGLLQLFMRSGFNGQLLEIFVTSIKVKRGLLLRPLTNFFGSNGLLQLFNLQISSISGIIINK
ncbi:hypothetical protein, partial [Paenilisteria rocourtiae]